MEDKVCELKHKAVDEKISHHENWLKEHEGKIDRLDRSDAVNTTALENLCKQIGNQTKAIWGLVSSVGLLLLGFFIWYVQNIKK